MGCSRKAAPRVLYRETDMERMDKYDGCISEWWLGIGINKDKRRYCKNCGYEPADIFDPYMDEYRQGLPRYCPRCGFRNIVKDGE